MSITSAVYGEQDLWNGYSDGGILPTQVLLLPGCTSTVLHAQVRDGGTVLSIDLTGSFSYNALNVSLNDVTGSFTTLAAYKNGALSETKISNIGLDVTKFLFTDYAYELAAYSGDDTFTGSSTNPVDDFIRGGAGNDKFAGFGVNAMYVQNGKNQTQTSATTGGTTNFSGVLVRGA